ncbi:hypothetical protein BX667DRAFT_340408 [Coemansia mojavensis]|nr:hypothetical protein BX667DRAFT_340408 [Coemansia mojavensis]
MRQSWFVICLDIHQGFKVNRLGDAIYAFAPEYIEEQITRSKFTFNPLPIMPPKNLKALSSLEKLPFEILEKISSYSLSIDDVFCFAMACYRTLEIGQRIIAKRGKKLLSPWAGKRIICVGKYGKDYPENVLTEKEKAIMSEKSLYNYADNFSCAYVYDESYYYKCPRVYKYCYGSSVLMFILKRFMAILSPVSRDEAKLVLLNMTTNEYVRKSRILPEYGFGFGHIILLHACWSSNLSTGIYCEEEIHRGPWAGHRFEITSIDLVNQDATDVSDIIVPRIKSIMDQDRGTEE